MKVSILDDYHDTLRTLPCFDKLEGRDVTIWNDHVQDTDTLAERLRDTEALVLIRERTKIRALCSSDCLNSSSSASAASIRISTSTPAPGSASSCRRACIPDAPSYATAEMTWGLILAAMRQIPQQMASLKAGRWQIGVGRRCAARRSASTATAGSAASSPATAAPSA